MLTETDLLNELQSLEQQKQRVMGQLANIEGAERMTRHLLAKMHQPREDAAKLLAERNGVPAAE